MTQYGNTPNIQQSSGNDKDGEKEIQEQECEDTKKRQLEGLEKEVTELVTHIQNMLDEEN